MKKKRKYDKTMPAAVYTYFRDFSEGGAPSLSKFARLVGITLEELSRWRAGQPKFDAACRECSEIRRDYLIDSALTRRQDPSFTKFLLTTEFGMGEEGEADRRLEVSLELIE